MSRVLRALGALLVLLVLILGVPLVLGGLIGNPLDSWSDLRAGDISDTAVIDILAAIAWIAWAQFALAFAAEAWARLRGVRLPGHVPGVFAGQQHLARALIAAIFVLGPTVVSLAAPAASFATPARATASVSVAQSASVPQSASVSRSAAQLESAPATATAHGSGQQARPSTHEYVVPASGGPGTYWDLAEHYLGSGDSWRQIWQLNEGRTQTDGSVMLSPGLLRPGWTVVMPGEAAAPPMTKHVTEHIVVRPGDTLSGIAERAGQPDWQQAWHVNADRAEPSGRHFTDPDLILPGWTVDVPTTVLAPAPVQPAAWPGTSTAPAGDTAGDRPAPAARTAPAATPAVGQGQRSELLREALEGGGALLAAGLLTALGLRRRRQFRNRRPGRSIAATPLALADVERAVLATGPPGQADVDFLDRALRSLAANAGPAGLPDLAAVRVVADQLDLRLAEPHPAAPPAPWTVDDTGFWWSTSLAEDLPPAGDGLAPYPTLVTVGTGPDGDRWLLDLERAGAVSLVGAATASADLARFMIAELALNGWSDHLNVSMVGFGSELVGLNPQRLTHHRDLAGSAEMLTAAISRTAETSQQSGTGVLQSRLTAGQLDGSPHLLFLDPAAAADDEALQRLLWAVRTQPDRTAVSVVLLADQSHTHQTRYQLELAGGRLQLGALGLDVLAQRLSQDQAADFARLIESVTVLSDRPTPLPVRQTPWTPWTDEAGRLRPELVGVGTSTASRPGPADGAAGIRLSAVAEASSAGDDGQTSSLLPDADAVYLRHAATTLADIQALAPDVPADLAARVEDASLDSDLANWYAEPVTRPRLSVLGPVRVRTAGNAGAVAGRIDFYSELVAYLGLAVPAAVPDDWWPRLAGTADLARALAMLGSWLGADPATGSGYLRQHEPQIAELLTDVDLFRRLRLRGQARGAQGLADLKRALELVRGEPFCHRRLGGYGWLVELPLDHLYTGMVVDVAHLVATRALAESDAVTARWAAEIGLSAGTQDDVALLDLVAVCTLEGGEAEREDHVRAVLRNHGVEVEEDLPPRTAEILRRRGWVAAAS